MNRLMAYLVFPFLISIVIVPKCCFDNYLIPLLWSCISFEKRMQTTFALLWSIYIYIFQVPTICLILTKALDRHQRFQREAAAAALSEFVRYRYVSTDVP